MTQSEPRAAVPVPGGEVYTKSFAPRFYEIDGQGVMFNMWYLAYVDEAVDGFFITRGLPYATWPELGMDVHVAHAEIDWKAPIRYADRADVLISTARIGRKSFTLDFAFRRDGAPLRDEPGARGRTPRSGRREDGDRCGRYGAQRPTVRAPSKEGLR
jgi:acyl-CoA thioester hydrolase